jgi:predicted TIM-barrel fold metal-dependent hydrolase
MEDSMEIIDSHVHLFQNKDAGQKAMRNISPTGFWGTLDELRGVLKEAGVAQAAAVATIPLRFMYDAALQRAQATESVDQKLKDELMAKMQERLNRFNTWLCEQCSAEDNLWAFVHADPFVGMDFLLQEVEKRAGAGGARGLKLHPMLGLYFPDDPVLWPLYKFAQTNEMPMIFHGGISPESPDIQYSHPERFHKILQDFPNLRIVVAHLGFNFWEATVNLASAFDNVAFDTSAALSGLSESSILSDDEALKLIRAIGTDKVLFGSDFPWGDPSQDLARIKRLGLSDAELESILGGNASRILGGL